MGMSTGIRAGIAFGAAIVVLITLETTLGASMDMLYLNFYNLTPTLHMSAGWAAQANNTLNGWVWWYRLFIILPIALGVWVVENYFMDTTYGRYDKLK